jgi:8-oxo-dGTP diphosphatase
MQRVTAAVIERDGMVLLARRQAGDPLAAKWEFPGGKIEPGETPEQCLARELDEELGVRVAVGEFLASSVYTYAHGAIELLAYRVRLVAGEPMARVHDELRWVARDALAAYELAPADNPIVDALLANT